VPSPNLPMLRGLGLEDSLQVPALIPVDPKLLQQPLSEVRLERGQRHVALPCAAQSVPSLPHGICTASSVTIPLVTFSSCFLQ
jgi:hypothetical protein